MSTTLPQRRRPTPRFTISAITSLALAWLAGCSALPEAAWPPRVLGEIEVGRPLRPGEPTLAEVPASDEFLTVLEWSVDPVPLRELFLGGKLLLELPPGAGEARLRMRYRLFTERGGRDPLRAAAGLEQRFPGSRVVRHHATLGPDPALAPDPYL